MPARAGADMNKNAVVAVSKRFISFSCFGVPSSKAKYNARIKMEKRGEKENEL
jgi:hypothetical protein